MNGNGYPTEKLAQTGSRRALGSNSGGLQPEIAKQAVDADDQISDRPVPELLSLLGPQQKVRWTPTIATQLRLKNKEHRETARPH